jgi:hypothetical protein
MRNDTFEVEAVPPTESVFFVFKGNVQLTAKHVNKLLTIVVVAFTAPSLRSDPKQVGFHYRVAPCQQFHTDSRARFQHFPILWPHHGAIGFRRVEKFKDIGLIKASELAERPD